LYPNGFTILDPKQMTSRMVDHLCQTGGHFIKGEVSAMEAQSADGVAFKVNGSRHHYEQAVLAGGAWSMQIAKGGCEELPLDTERGYHVLFPESGELLNRPVGFADAGFYMTPMCQGLRAAGTVELGGLNAAPNPERLSYIERRVRGALPDVGPVSDTWLGFRPTLPDSLPVIGRSKQNPNLIFAFGHHHLGLTLGGITGKLVGEIAVGATPSLDVTPFRPDRFS
jgi:D-amino-acid dehydrogenase